MKGMIYFDPTKFGEIKKPYYGRWSLKEIYDFGVISHHWNEVVECDCFIVQILAHYRMRFSDWNKCEKNKTQSNYHWCQRIGKLHLFMWKEHEEHVLENRTVGMHYAWQCSIKCNHNAAYKDRMTLSCCTCMHVMKE